MKYTALTIGPIYKTLQSVKSTKAIWSASYMFSYLIKEIIKKLQNDSDSLEIILPSFEIEINGKPVSPLHENFQTGLFPDRIIYKTEKDIHIQNIIDEVINEFADKVNNDIKVDEDKLHAYLKNYINCYHLSIGLDEKSNVILEINNILDSLELQQRVIEDAEKDYLNAFFERIKPYNFLIKEEFEERPFPSTIEITTSEFSENEEYKKTLKILKERDNEESQANFVKEIKAIVNDNFRNYQKYIAVVQADGDNIGSFIKALYEQDNKEKLIKRFSNNLLAFAIEAVELIKKYNGTPIYAGGDDLLYFMPVAQLNIESNTPFNVTVFNLITQIDNLFKKYFTEYNKDAVDFKSLIQAVKKKPSMSYGISISYYKFPLNQALAEGVNQLFYTAKKTTKKNAVSYSVLKHSGQHFGATFHKDDSSFTTFTGLINTKFEIEEFIKSIIQKLDPQRSVLMAIGEKSEVERENMIDNFFDNNFNEGIHTVKNSDGTKELIPFLQGAKKLIKNVYSENSLEDVIDDELKKTENDKNIKKIYSALRFIEFIHNKEERE